LFRFKKSARDVGLATIEAAEMRRYDELGKWLRDLPKPVALLACNDMRAQQIMTVCDVEGIRVPDEVAVLGVDNDDVLCELCDPPLSSIDPDVEQIGYAAAALLDKMVRGETPPERRILVEPRCVVARRSTDALAIGDREAAEAIRFVQDHACELELEIGDIVDQLSISRATLNRWFRKWLRRSPAEEISRVRLDRAKLLLATTDLSLEDIAQHCGFRYAESVCRAMKRTTGQVTADFRHRRTLP
jgi:LacI family transcriptional regulator